MESHKRFSGDKATFLSSVFNGIPRHIRRFVEFIFPGCQQSRVVHTNFSLVEL